MQEILKQHNTVRIDKNGKIVPKPIGWELISWKRICEEFRVYRDYTEVIKLPTLIEFVEYIRVDNPHGFVMSGNKVFADEHRKQMACDLDAINEYATFLKTKFSKGQFVPCDEDGNVLIEPEFTIGKNGTKIYSVGSKYIEQFQKAQEAVIFVNDNKCFCMPELKCDKWVNYKTFNQALNSGVVLLMKIK